MEHVVTWTSLKTLSETFAGGFGAFSLACEYTEKRRKSILEEGSLSVGPRVRCIEMAFPQFWINQSSCFFALTIGE